jgi:hypothetical protein
LSQAQDLPVFCIYHLCVFPLCKWELLSQNCLNFFNTFYAVQRGFSIHH